MKNSLHGLQTASRTLALFVLGVVFVSTIYIGEAEAVSGGRKAAPGAYPFMVSLISADEKKAIHLCGATLIAPTWVLTAVHCLLDDLAPQGSAIKPAARTTGSECIPLSQYDIYVGSNDFKNGDRIEVVEACWRDDYGAIPYDNDVALLRLKRRPGAKFKWSTVPLVDSAKEPSLGKEGGAATVIGWGERGAITEGGPKDDALFETVVKLVATPSCKKQIYEFHRAELDRELEARLKKLGVPEQKIGAVNADVWRSITPKIEATVTENMLCAGDDDGLKNHCHQDSGGPLLVRDPSGKWTQIGIVSWGEPCTGEKIPPAVYTRVSRFTSWVAKYVK